MHLNDNRRVLLELIRSGIERPTVGFPKTVDWDAIQTLAAEQGLSAIVLDGIEQMPIEMRPPRRVLLQWIGEVMQGESQYDVQLKSAIELAVLFRHHHITTYVLKGVVISECYPKPNHRVSSDFDCFLLPESGGFNAWRLGNDLMRANGVEVKEHFYKHSTFTLPGLLVENHQFMTAFRCNKRLQKMEKYLQELFIENKDKNSLFNRVLS